MLTVACILRQATAYSVCTLHRWLHCSTHPSYWDRVDAAIRTGVITITATVSDTIIDQDYLDAIIVRFYQPVPSYVVYF